MTESPSVSAVAPWYGSNRMLAPIVGREVSGCPWVGVPFAGGMSELVHITARTLMVNDLHRHVVNMARVLAHAKQGPEFYRWLRREIFHPDSLQVCQQRCRMRETVLERETDLLGGVSKTGVNLADVPNVMGDLWWARDYFVAAWMPRHGSSGTKKEFDAGMSTRWNAAGGDSAAHYWSAVRSITPMRRLLRRANFTTMDAFAFLDKCKDDTTTGIYCDPPFPGPGDSYAHRFGEVQLRHLAAKLSTFKSARVVCRFYDVPLIRELYPEPQWTWRHLVGRKQTNDKANEVLIMNGPSREVA